MVLRILRGEDLDALSRELNVTASRLAQWRDAFLVGGQANLRSRPDDAQSEENRRLKEKVGEQAMEIELLYEKVHRIEAEHFPERRRSRR